MLATTGIKNMLLSLLHLMFNDFGGCCLSCCRDLSVPHTRLYCTQHSMLIQKVSSAFSTHCTEIRAVELRVLRVHCVCRPNRPSRHPDP